MVLTTDRLILRRFTEGDAPFVLQLVNEPAWLRFIGDRGVRTLEDAREYLRDGPLDMYARHGYGLYLVARKEDGVALGMCGLVRREGLSDVDIGFAFLPEFWGRGYAAEAAAAALAHARDDCGLQRVLAITSLDNTASMRVLEKIGMTFQRIVELHPDNPVRLFEKLLTARA